METARGRDPLTACGVAAAAWSAGGGDAKGRRSRIWRSFGPSGSREPRRGIDGRRERHRAEAGSQQRQVPVRCSGAVLLRARRNGGSYTGQISAAKGARPRDGSPSTPATQLAQQTRAAAPLVPSFWPPQPPTAESGSAQPNCRIRQFTPSHVSSRGKRVGSEQAGGEANGCDAFNEPFAGALREPKHLSISCFERNAGEAVLPMQ